MTILYTTFFKHFSNLVPTYMANTSERPREPGCAIFDTGEETTKDGVTKLNFNLTIIH